MPPRPAAQHTRRARGRPNGIGDRVALVGAEPVPAPFEHVSMHIIKAPAVGKPASRNGGSAPRWRGCRIRLVPVPPVHSHFLDVRISGQGAYWTTEEDLRELFMTTIPVVADKWEKKRVLLFLHGGLNSEEDVARRVVAYRDVLLANDIYPLHIMWETGAGETLTDIVKDVFTQDDERAGSVADWMKNFRNQLSEAKNRAFELTVSRLGLGMWREMKENARLASAARDGAMQIVARHAKSSLALGNAADWEVHIVAHSAGSIFAAHLMPVIAGLGVPIETLQFMAPAMTTALFREALMPLIAQGLCPKPTMYILDDKAEQSDTVAKIYGHSLLYLVSNAFEEASRMPLLGMQKFLQQSDAPGAPIVPTDIAGLFSTTGRTPNLIVANQGVAPLSKSLSHGGFDNDVTTMNTILRRILGKAPAVEFNEKHMAF